MAEDTLRRKCERRLEGLRQSRQGFDQHWKELANFIMPWRYLWLNQSPGTRGSSINAQILDSTGTLAAGNLGSGMLSGMSSPTRPWFKLKIKGHDVDTSNPVSLWFADAQLIMLEVFAKSNYYNCAGVKYYDLGTFGTAPMIIYEDPEDVIRCHNFAPGEYYLAVNGDFVVDTLYREFNMTLDAVVKKWGKDRLPIQIRNRLEGGQREALASDIHIGHAIEPNEGAVARHFKWQEIHWVVGVGDNDGVLDARGYHEFPVVAPRWMVTGNEAYGRSPGMIALPDIKQLQHETKRKAQAIDKIVNPPMLADVQLRNQPASMLPGGITYVAGLSASNAPGLRPAYQINPSIMELSQDIAQIQARIEKTYHNDLFLMISQLDTVRTASEIDGRREEKFIMLGPVLERNIHEDLGPTIDRVFNICFRAGLFPPPPPEIAGQDIEVEYISTLAMAQKATPLTGIERLLATAGNLVAVQPDVFDKIDADAAIDEYASQLGVSPKIVRDSKRVEVLRSERRRQQAKAEAMTDAAAAAQGAEILSRTEVGGGQNALQQMIGG